MFNMCELVVKLMSKCVGRENRRETRYYCASMRDESPFFLDDECWTSWESSFSLSLPLSLLFIMNNIHSLL